MNHRIIVLAIAYLAIGCADGEDLEFQRTGDSPPGPGIVTGKQGAIIIDLDPNESSYENVVKVARVVGRRE